MAMLKLPTEIFEKIIGELAQAESNDLAASYLVGHRLVCRTFNNFIIDNICAQEGKRKLRVSSDTEHMYRLRLFGTEILHWKVVHGFHSHVLVRSVAVAANELVHFRGKLSPEAARRLRSEYAAKLCEVVKGFGFERFKTLVSDHEGWHQMSPHHMLILAAAADEGFKFTSSDLRTLRDVLFGKIFITPNILEAVVAANQVHKVHELLEWIRNNVRDKKETGNWDEMRNAARVIGEALRVAIRMSRDKIAFKIISYLKEHWHPLGRSVSWSLVDRIYEDCVSYVNMALFATILYWKQDGELPESPGPNVECKMIKENFQHILRRGNPTLVRHVLDHQMINPDRLVDCNGYNPQTALWMALSTRNYKMARVLIEEGVDMDRVMPGTKTTAYWQAYEDERGDDQYFLITWAADWRPIKEHGKPRSVEHMLNKPPIRMKRSRYRPYYEYRVGARRGRLDSDEDWDNYVTRMQDE